ncbi:MAG: energy transducer TonB [Akkermansiaceae bacterium]
MNPILHALNIGTLANWLSLLAFGAVAVIVPGWQAGPPVPKEEEIRMIADDFTLGDVISSEPAAAGESLANAPSEASEASETPEITDEPLPEPPALPEIAEFSPLPEIPDLPTPKPVAKPAPVAPQAAPSARPPVTTSRPAGGGQPGASGGASSGASNAARLAQGRMPQPNYPQYSRRNNQTGTVVVEFTVDESGRVISAHAKSPSPWPLLNNEAVRTVRSWRFPPGGVMKLQRPIIFQLR